MVLQKSEFVSILSLALSSSAFTHVRPWCSAIHESAEDPYQMLLTRSCTSQPPEG
jgi:hypothetical protein